VKLNSLAAWMAVLASLVLPATALAQKYEPIEGRVRESIPAAPFLASAYGFIWLAVIVYVVLVARRLTRVQADMEELRRRLERGARP
jgi:heme exporter protein D